MNIYTYIVVPRETIHKSANFIITKLCFKKRIYSIYINLLTLQIFCHKNCNKCYLNFLEKKIR